MLAKVDLSNRFRIKVMKAKNKKPETVVATGTDNSDTDNHVDTSRRRFLTAGVSVVGGLGASATAWPFIASMNPSARAHAIGAPVTVDISQLQPGEIIRDQWRGKPIWIVRRDAVSA